MAVASAFIAFLILLALAIYLHRKQVEHESLPPDEAVDPEAGPRLAEKLQEIREKQIEDLKGG